MFIRDSCRRGWGTEEEKSFVCAGGGLGGLLEQMAEQQSALERENKTYINLQFIYSFKIVSVKSGPQY